MNNQPPQAPINVPLDQLQDIPCIKCGCPDFITVTHMKHINKIVSPNGQEGIANMNMQRCIKCGWNFNATEWKAFKEQNGETESAIIKES